MSKAKSSKVELTVEHPVSHKEHDYLRISFEFSIGNDGIGAYEFWGARGFDQGQTYIEEWYPVSVELVRKGKSRKLKQIPEYIQDMLDKWMENNEDTVLEELGEAEYIDEPDFDYYEEAQIERNHKAI